MELVEHQVRGGDGAEVHVGLAPRQTIGAEEKTAQHLVDGGKGHVGLKARVIGMLACLYADAGGDIGIVRRELIRQHPHRHGVDTAAREIESSLSRPLEGE